MPPGMMLGPLRAPSSPPETPVPMYSRPLLSTYLRAADGVVEVAVAAVDDDVARLQERQQLLDELVHRPARP